MGCYDTVEVNKPCLHCGEKIISLQTKASLSTMNHYKKGDIISFSEIYIKNGSIEVHGVCDYCGWWHTGLAVIKNGRLFAIKNLALGERVSDLM